jgi:hypothetical protein
MSIEENDTQTKKEAPAAPKPPEPVKKAKGQPRKLAVNIGPVIFDCVNNPEEQNTPPVPNQTEE